MKLEIYTDIQINNENLCVGFKVIDLTKDEFIRDFGNLFKYDEVQHTLNSNPSDQNPVIIKKSGFVLLTFYLVG